jgi:hypothetical protein
LAKVIINHVGSAPDNKRRVWICLKSQANAQLAAGKAKADLQDAENL